MTTEKTHTESMLGEDDKLIDDEGGELTLNGHLGSLLPLLADLDEVCGTNGHLVLCRGGEIGMSVIESWRDALEGRELIAVEMGRDQGTRVVWRVLACQVHAPALNYQPGRTGTREELFERCEVREMHPHEAMWIEMFKAFLEEAGTVTLN